MELKQNKMKAKAIIIGAFFGWALFMLTACMTQQKAVSYLSQKQLLPQVCADSFPAKADTVIKEGQTIETVEVWTDTLYVTDTIDNTSLPDTIEKIKVLTRTVTKSRVDTLVQTKVDDALVKALQIKLATSEQKAAKLEARFKSNRTWKWGSLGVNILLIFLLGWLFGKKLKKTV